MEVAKNLLNKYLFFVLVFMVICCSGCQKSAEDLTQTMVFFPAPIKPKLQFVRSYSKPSDVGVKGPSAFELFVVGKGPEVESIEKPYGVSIYDGKIYVCDVSRRLVEVLNLRERTFGYLTKDHRLLNPVNIYIEKDGTKYIADPTAGGVFVFDKEDNSIGIMGKELKISPIDVVIRGRQCYVTDSGSNQVVVFDLVTEKEVIRMGKKGSGIGEFEMIGGIAVDADENVYVSDKSKGDITKFNKAGIYQTTIGKSGDAVHEFVRPKGIEIDREGRLWIIDAATDVGKIYGPDGKLLMYFGLPGNKPGMMNLPAEIKLDYDNIELFREYIAEGADIDFIALVSNQYGLNKVSVYAFGSFPIQEKQAQEQEKQWELERKKKFEEKLGASEKQRSEP